MRFLPPVVLGPMLETMQSFKRLHEVEKMRARRKIWIRGETVKLRKWVV